MLFCFAASFEPGPYRWLGRIVYFCALICCLGSVVLLIWWVSVGQTKRIRFAGQSIVAILVILGLFTAASYPLMIIEYYSRFPGSQWMYQWWNMMAIFSCLMAVVLHIRLILVPKKIL